MSQIEKRNAAYQACLNRLREHEESTAVYLDTLIEIRDQEYYRIGGYETFEDFCSAECPYAARTIRDMIVANEVRKQIANDSGGTPPLEISDSAAVALASVPKDKRVETLDKATQLGRGKATAKAIKEAKAASGLGKVSYGKPIESAPEPKPQKPKKNGSEVVGTKDRKAAAAALGVLIRALDKIGVGLAMAEHTRAIDRAIKEA